MPNRFLRGAIAGLVATAPMTVLMLVWYRRLPRAEQYPLPPAEITEKLVEETVEALEVAPPQNPSVLKAATWAGHFGYGALMGAIYGLLPEKGPPIVRGIGWGLAVWTGSYMGWLPAAHILRPADEHPARRNLLMIAAHVVWGASVGVFDKFGRTQNKI